jgi:hypothetical protein
VDPSQTQQGYREAKQEAAPVRAGRGADEDLHPEVRIGMAGGFGKAAVEDLVPEGDRRLFQLDDTDLGL